VMEDGRIVVPVKGSVRIIQPVSIGLLERRRKNDLKGAPLTLQAPLILQDTKNSIVLCEANGSFLGRLRAPPRWKHEQNELAVRWDAGRIAWYHYNTLVTIKPFDKDSSSEKHPLSVHNITSATGVMELFTRVFSTMTVYRIPDMQVLRTWRLQFPNMSADHYKFFWQASPQGWVVATNGQSVHLYTSTGDLVRDCKVPELDRAELRAIAINSSGTCAYLLAGKHVSILNFF